jgi:hypothetical protein
LSAAGLRRHSGTATTSNREMTAARQAIACQSRFGESFCPASHLAVRSPSARMLHAPTKRFVSVSGGDGGVESCLKPVQVFSYRRRRLLSHAAHASRPVVGYKQAHWRVAPP